jgi:pimeloyl-ACP methyl ester carboxylesterase
LWPYAAFRTALDHPKSVSRLVFLDGVPIGEALGRADARFAQDWWHWFFYDRIMVAGPEIVGVRLTQAAYAHGLALALPEKVAMARPTDVGRALATYEIPIEGRDEWLAAAGLSA